MSHEKEYYVYILTNRYNDVLYVGVTNGLARRLQEHTDKVVKGFTSKYNLHKLVYYEATTDAYSAITREKQLKGLLRSKKRALITTQNPKWKDLSLELFN